MHSASWYAVQTISRHERLVAQRLETQGIIVFFPTFTTVHRWSDRLKKVELPLFPGYLFLRVVMSSDVRRRVQFARGVAGIVTMAGEPVPIPEEQIESVQKVLASSTGCTAHPFLKVGQRVRIRGGALDGIEGVLTGRNGGDRLVVSIEGIQRSLQINIEGYEVEAL